MFNQNTIAEQGSYSTYAGSDITVVIGGKVVGSIQGLSYSVTREKGPLFVMKGIPDPIAYARGKRVTAGTLVFLTLDRQALIGHFDESNYSQEFYGNQAEIRYDYAEDNSSAFSLFQQAVNGATSIATEDNPFATLDIQNAGDERIKTKAWYADQILPFDIHVSLSNEYGQVSKRSFAGVEIVNEGAGFSVDDLAMEEQYSFVCLGVTPMRRVFGPGKTAVGG